MNERIAKLYDQAIIIEDAGDYVCGELDPVKFAQLILKDNENLLKISLEALEYMETDWQRKEGLGFDLITSSKMFDAIKKLKEHFGVEL